MTLPDFFPVIPEIFLLSAACVVLMVEVYGGNGRSMVCYGISQLALLMTAGLVLWVYTKGGDNQTTFLGTFKLDTLAMVLKIAICLITSVVFIYSRKYLALHNTFRGEYLALALFGVIGMLVMTSAYSLLTIYLGLELLSLSLYAMVAFHRDSPTACEAAIKYFILGAIASGMLLYGMSMIYGASGSLDIATINQAVTAGQINTTVMVFGIVFVVVGLGFKFGAVPFHMWVPDIYHGAPTSVTVFIGTAPKLAAFAMLMRLLVEGLGGLHAQWQEMIVVLSVLSIGIGNIVAIAQTNIKRMLAYSTIAHVGFIMLGILSGTANGYASAMFYVLVYALMTLGAFGMIILLSHKGFEAERIEDFKGLNERSPWYALMMGILILSMAGVPPMVGFYAKLSVLQAVVEQAQAQAHVVSQQALLWLVIYAVVLSVVGAFYYLRVIRMMYFEKPVDTSPIECSMDFRLAVSANGIVILALGIYPTGLLGICLAALGAG